MGVYIELHLFKTVETATFSSCCTCNTIAIMHCIQECTAFREAGEKLARRQRTDSNNELTSKKTSKVLLHYDVMSASGAQCLLALTTDTHVTTSFLLTTVFITK